MNIAPELLQRVPDPRRKPKRRTAEKPKKAKPRGERDE